MDRFGEKEPHRFNDPDDASGSIVGDEGMVGGAVVDLRHALILNHISLASVDIEEGEQGKTYALALAGNLPTGEQREMMILLNSHASAHLVSELCRTATLEHDTSFLAMLLALFASKG